MSCWPAIVTVERASCAVMMSCLGDRGVVAGLARGGRAGRDPRDRDAVRRREAAVPHERGEDAADAGEGRELADEPHGRDERAHRGRAGRAVAALPLGTGLVVPAEPLPRLTVALAGRQLVAEVAVLAVRSVGLLGGHRVGVDDAGEPRSLLGGPGSALLEAFDLGDLADPAIRFGRMGADLGELGVGQVAPLGFRQRGDRIDDRLAGGDRRVALFGEAGQDRGRGRIRGGRCDAGAGRRGAAVVERDRGPDRHPVATGIHGGERQAERGEEREHLGRRHGALIALERGLVHFVLHVEEPAWRAGKPMGDDRRGGGSGGAARERSGPSSGLPGQVAISAR
jgi:hypothetical protein